jgi:hypothetical protein
MDPLKSVVAAIVMSLVPIAVSAVESVMRFHLASEPDNDRRCSQLNANLARTHSVVFRSGNVKIISAGGIEGRMTATRAGVYEIAFELSGLRSQVVADLSAAPMRLTVTERRYGCRWAARPD